MDLLYISNALSYCFYIPFSLWRYFLFLNEAEGRDFWVALESVVYFFKFSVRAGGISLSYRWSQHSLEVTRLMGTRSFKDLLTNKTLPTEIFVSNSILRYFVSLTHTPVWTFLANYIPTEKHTLLHSKIYFYLCNYLCYFSILRFKLNLSLLNHV